MLALGFALAIIVGAAAPAYANEDVVHFGETIHVRPGTEAHDTVCFFCSVDAEGDINGDVVSFFGNVHIHGRANHDVVNFFGRVTVDDNGSIGQDLVNFFGGVQLGENVSVGKDAVVMFGSMDAASSASVGGDRVTMPAFIFWVPLMLIISAIWLVVHEVRGRRARMMMRGF